MGIQDRDYYHDKHRRHSGGSDRRDYSQRLREMEDSGQSINIKAHIPKSQRAPATPYSVGILLIFAVVCGLGFLAYKVAKVFF